MKKIKLIITFKDMIYEIKKEKYDEQNDKTLRRFYNKCVVYKKII